MSDQLDTQLFEVFFAKSLLHELKGKNGTLVLGRMGAGKSTTISIQQGAVAEQDDEGKYAITWRPTHCPETSDGFESQTLNVGVYPDPQSGKEYYDTAGLNENRGHNHRTWTTFSTSMSLSLLKQIDAVIVVINYNAAFGERGAGMADLAECLELVIGSSDECHQFYKSMIFVITAGFVGPKKVSPQRIKDSSRAILEFQQGKLAGIKEKYKKPEECSADDKRDMEKTEASIRLVDAISNAGESRIFMSYPDGEDACTKQRRTILDTILATAPINKQLLTKLVEKRQTHTLEVIKMLGEIAVNTTTTLIDFNKATSAAIKEFKEKEAINKAIRDNWVKTKENELSYINTDLKRAQEEKANLNKQINDLKNSNDIKVYRDFSIRETKSGFWSWWVGKQWAVKDFNYTEDWCIDVKVHGANMTHDWGSKKEKDKNLGTKAGSNADIKIHFVSDSGRDLHASVQLMRTEKDLPDTKKRWEALEKQVKEKEEPRIAKLEAKKKKCQETKTAEELMRFCNQNLEDCRKTLDAVYKKMKEPCGSTKSIQREDDKGSPILPTLSEVMAGVYHLLDCLGDEDEGNTLRKDLSTATKKNIDDFRKEHAKAVGLQKQAAENSDFTCWMNVSAQEFGFGKEIEGKREAVQADQGPSPAEKAKLAEIEKKKKEAEDTAEKVKQDIQEVESAISKQKRRNDKLIKELAEEKEKRNKLEEKKQRIQRQLQEAKSGGYA